MKKFLQAIAGSALLALLMLFAVPAHASTKYTVTCDISNVTGSLTATNAHAYVWNSSSGTNNTWPGVTGSADGNVITFTFSLDYEPTNIIFNNGNNGGWQTDNLTFTNGAKYTLNTDKSATITTGIETTTYTVYCNISNMGDSKWNASDVCAYVSDGTSNTTVGNGYESNDVITFNFSVDYTPTTIIFKEGSTNQTKEATFANGATYYIDSSYNVTSTIHTVYCDVSNMDGTKWTNSNIHAYIWSDSNNTWPGDACTSYDGDVFTFTFNTSWTPTSIIFNGGNGGTQTVDLTFADGKTYYIGSQNSEGKYVLYSTTISNENIDKISVVPSTSKNTGVFDAFDLTYDTSLGMWTGTFTTNNSSNTSVYASFTIEATDKSGNSYVWGPNMGNTETGYWVEKAKGSVKSSAPYYQGGLTPNTSYTFYLRDNSTDITNFDWKIAATGEADVNLPYTKSDFSEEPKYFLVGPRMGMWHLQPEWELIKQSDGTWKVDGGRFLFCDHIAVAKVTSYDEYIHSEYTAYTNPSVTITKSNCTGISLPNNISVSAASSTYPLSTSGQCTTVQFADPYNVYSDNGTWIKEITLSGDDSSGYSLTFDVSASTDNTHRVFALVGENIVHKNYNNSTTGTNDPRTSVYSLFSTKSNWYGWQESWIQYDASGRPYVDANNNFVYHTAYTDDILNKNKVKFQIDLTLNGASTNFDYSSDNIIFVDYTQLSDLDSDPYREFYKHFVGSSVAIADGATVSGGNETDGTDYAFKINTKIGDTTHDTAAGSANWQCFVVRDVWVKGEFKIWSGWGGTMCRVADANNNDYLALWDNLNYGPYVTTANMQTPITDIKAGINSDQAISLNSVNGGAASNYFTPGNELTYYSRIILLYDQTNKNYSYVMFIQGEASPAIKAFLEGDNSDQPYYTWNLQNTDNVSETVTGYTVTRYRVTDEGDIDPVVVQTVTDLSDAPSAYTNDITYEEKISLNPGTYRYKIVVTFKDSNNNTTEEREAYSNQITVYGDAIAPEVRITQVVVLNEDGYKALGKSDYDATKTYYLTYGTNSDADYYMINSDATIEQVSASVALDVLSKPAYYVWDALLWVRALDYTAFTRYYDQAGITVSKDPSITLSVYEGADNTKTASTTGIKTSLFTATFTSGSTNQYIGTIVDRKGVLCSGNIKAEMTYTLQDPSTGEDKAATTGDDTAPYSFVIGQPYSLDAYFKHVNDAFKDDSGTPLKIAATTQASKHSLTVADNFKGYYEIRVASSISNATYTDTYGAMTVTVPEDGIQYERHLNLNVTFYRPNISEAIYNQNEIVYTVSAKNVIPEKPDTKCLLPNFSAYNPGGQYIDNTTEEYSSEKKYKLTVYNTHPADCINTDFEIEKTVFIDKTSSTNTLEATHSYGNLTLTKSNTPESTTSISSLGLGVNPGSEKGKNKWFLYSYNGFSHTMTSTEDSKDVKVNSTKLFLLELSEGSNANYGKTLWIHDDDALTTEASDSNVGRILNNVHYIAELAASEPSITVTPIYICSSELSIEPDSDGGLAEYTTSGSVNVIRRSTTTGTAEVTYETSNGYIISATKDLTKATDVAVLEGTPVTVENDNAPVLTGIESVAADDIYGEAVYYNLQGIQVSNPIHGQVYIRCQKGQNEKVVY